VEDANLNLLNVERYQEVLLYLLTTPFNAFGNASTLSYLQREVALAPRLRHERASKRTF
jgi:hypothetical protein